MRKRDKEDLTFGIRSVIEAIKQGKTINKILLQKGLKGDLIKELLILIHKENIVVQKVPIQKLNHMVKKSPRSYCNGFTSCILSNRLDCATNL